MLRSPDSLMSPLEDKHILLGISGGIAAYKAADLTRRLRLAGAQVRVVMSPGATQFVTPLTFQALSGQPVRTQLWDGEEGAGMGHIELARWADFIVIAPASADMLARLAHGLADELLSTLCLAAQVPLWVAPAMNQAMWSHAATQDNLRTLLARGVRVLGPAHGDQACGEQGPGRMLEPEAIVLALAAEWAGGPLAGVRVLVSAGPTREPLDPVRFIANRSSGKMGYALAAAARAAGAQVSLVSGPVSLAPPIGATLIPVETAAQMHEAVLAQVAHMDIYIGAAAVADYRPRTAAVDKIKKTAPVLTLELERTADILTAVANHPQRPRFVVGFAAETTDLARYAQEKLAHKGVDMMAANEASAFEADDNALEVYWRDGHTRLTRTNKTLLAAQLMALIAQHYPKK